MAGDLPSSATVDSALDVVSIAGGVVIVAVVLDSALRSFVLPRGAVVRLTRVVSVTVRKGFDTVARRVSSYEGRDRVMALYAPIALLTLVTTWLLLVGAGFTLIFHAFDGGGWRGAFSASGSSLFTLGFARPPGAGSIAVAFVEAAIGLALLALLIAYLPTLYGAFSRREVLVAQLSSRAGAPPSAVELLQRAHAIDELGDLDEVWTAWQRWFAELEETHTSLGYLNFFRSPDPGRSWVTAAGVVLDAASLHLSTISVRWSPPAGLCVRSGYTALRAIADFFDIPYESDPGPDDAISIAREEYDDACGQLADAGVPLRPDRERAWRDFAGWRVNYDAVLLGLAGLTMAPYAMWSSDRSVNYRVRVRRRHR